MSDYRDLLEQERRRHAMRDGSLGGLRRRRDRKRRNGQIFAGVIAFLIAAAGVGGGLFALRSSTGPQPADRTPSPTPTSALGGEAHASPVSGPIQFIDDLRGWMVDEGQILATSDGGQTWNVQLSGPSNVKAIAILDGQRGWALFDGGLLRTTDGGSQWVTWSDEGLSSVQFVTEKIGWGVGPVDGGTPGPLMQTEDGGATWTRRSLDVNSVCFVTERFGWAAGPHEAGVAVFRTADGGLNWTEIPIPLPGGDFTRWAATVRCAGEAAWILATGDGGAGHISYGMFRMTADGSEPEPRLQDLYTHPLGLDKGIPEAQGAYPGPLTAPEAQSARFITWCPQCFGDLPFLSLERTQDAGATWATNTKVLDSNEPAEPLGISFIDQDRGWILLRDLGTGTTAVLRTSDGGETWEQL